MKYKFLQFFVLAVLIITGGSFLNPTTVHGLANCSVVAPMRIEIKIGSDPTIYTTDGGVYVPVGQSVHFEVRTIAEPSSQNSISYPSSNPPTYSGPYGGSPGRPYDTTLINSTGEIAVMIIENCAPDPNPGEIITLNLSLQPYSVLTVSKAGTGTGTVTAPVGVNAPTGVGDGINCGTTNCTEKYDTGISVALTPTPTAGSTFAGWSGDADCTDGSVTMNADKSCIATFNLTPSTHTATAVAGTGGSITSSNVVSNISDGSFASFSVAPAQNYSINKASVGGDCPKKSPLSLAWTDNNYKTEDFSSTDPANCTVNFSFIPTLSCAHDTNQAEPIYPNAGAKFRATGGTGTYSWTYSTIETAGNPTTGIEVWPAWSNSGTKTATVTSGSQTANCTVYITPAVTPMSGTLTPASSTCTIVAGGNSCTKLLTWTTTNPVAVSAVTSATGTPSPGTSVNNGSQTFTVPYNNGVGSIFYLYNNAVNLAQATVTPSCASGAPWDIGSGTCKTSTTPVNGSCAATHNNCLAGTSVDTTDTATLFKWNCNGLNGGIDEACTEAKTIDLVASLPTPTTATPGAISFSSTITNGGTVSTGAGFTNLFQISASSNGTSPTNYTTTTTSAVAAGGTTITSKSITLTAGTYYMRVCADNNASFAGTIAESSETNNCSSGTPWTTVTVGTTNTPPTGYFDVASCTDLEGWAYDPDVSSTSINVKVYKEGNVLVGTYPTNVLRGDVNTSFGITGNHGFQISTPASLKDGVAHTLNVYAVDSAGGADVLTGASPRSITCSASLPDLTASAPTPTTDVDVNVVRTYTSTITNQGTASTGASFPYFFQLSSPWWNEAGALYDRPSKTMSVLGAGGNAPATDTFAFTGVGHKSIRVCADKTSSAGGGVITENDETNNCSPWTNLTVTDVAAVSGTLTSSSCTIASGASSCNTTLNWNILNPIPAAFTAITTPEGITVPGTSGTSGTTTYSVSGGSPNGSRTFYLYHNASLLNQATATTTCASGTSWYKGYCKENPSPIPIVTISANPTVGVVGIVNPALTWSATYSPTSCTFTGDWENTDGNAVSGTNVSQGILRTIKTYTYTLTCTNASGESVPVSATVMVNDGSRVDGACSSPATHYTCASGASVDNLSSPSRWTWICNGLNGGASPSCFEKRSPGFIED